MPSTVPPDIKSSAACGLSAVPDWTGGFGNGASINVPCSSNGAAPSIGAVAWSGGRWNSAGI